MTTKGNTGRVIRLDDETWEAYGELCAEKGIARASDVRMYIKREVAAWQAEKRRRQREEQTASAA
jgi:hypothetical protein